jgi:prolyl oligopeptidase
MQRSFGCGVALWVAVAICAAGQTIHGRDGIRLPAPPAVEAIPVVDDYFGTRIADSYRWLEDGKSSATRAFIDAQNAYTARYMKQARMRADVVDDLTALEDVSVTGVPLQRANSLFFSRRLAGEQQASIYMRSLAAGPKILPSASAKPGTAIQDRRIVDPAALSRDSDTSVSLRDVSRDGALLAYAERQGGADEAVIRIYNVATGKTLEDELPLGRYFSVSFSPDGASIYYARNDQQGTLLFEHRIGTLNSRDMLLLGREFHGEPLTGNDLFYASVSDDGRYLVVEIDRGVPAHRVDIVFRDLSKPGSFFEILVWGMEARFNAIYAHGAWLVKTDYQAPKGRILKADPGVLPDVWQTIVLEGSDTLEDWSVVGGKLYVKRLKDAVAAISIYALDGKPAGNLGGGMAQAVIADLSTVSGRSIDRYGYYSLQSFIQPATIFRLDTLTGKQEIFFQPRTPFDPNQYELKQVFFTSKDGTKVPMFIAGKKGLKQDGSERLLMTGYGGFNLSETPIWNPTWAWWIEQGGWFALPNLRGGGEYGESWHRQGMFEKKQNVFDDWFAAAEYLIAHQYTSPQHLAIFGRSNGGLLMGASITQRPQLFAAVLCGYPLLDMLRSHKFLVGSYWTTEYGSAEKEEQFRYLLKYSPYQNVKAGTAYPAVLFFTGDADTRVDPLHARKMTALLQAASSSGRPVLLHHSLGGGHSAGVSVAQKIEDDADQLTFLWTESGQAKP